MARAPAYAALTASTERATADHKAEISAAAVESGADFAGACAGGERERIGGAVADLPGPYRNSLPGEVGPRLRQHRRFLLFALGRCRVEHHREGLVALARCRNRLAHGIEVEEAGPRRDDHQGCGTDRLLHHHPHGRCGVDEHPLVAFDRGEGDGPVDPAHGALQRRLAVDAQGMPQRERALRIGIYDETALPGVMGASSEMRGQRALSGTAFARRERDDIHFRLSPDGQIMRACIRMVNAWLKLPRSDPSPLAAAFRRFSVAAGTS